jgi:hypothetical protein
LTPATTLAPLTYMLVKVLLRATWLSQFPQDRYTLPTLVT